MQLLGICIMLGLLILLFLAAIYFARGQTSHRTRYYSWSAILGPRSVMGGAWDTREQISHGSANRQGRRSRRKHSR